MRFATVRDFKTNATRYLKGTDDIYITRRGKPVAVLSPVKPKTIEAAMIEMGRIIEDAGLSKNEVLALLQEARKEAHSR